MYREFLVMRKALLWFFGIMAAFGIFALIMTVTQSNGHRNSSEFTDLAAPVSMGVCIFAAIFGVALGNGSREAARVLWTTPLSRVRSALELLAVDASAIAIAFVGTLAMAVGWFFVAGLLAPVQLHGSFDWVIVAQSLTFVYAVYGWSAIIGMIGRRMAYAGLLALPLLILWQAFANAGGWFGKVVRMPAAANPVLVYSVGGSLESQPSTNLHRIPWADALSWLTPELTIVVLAATAVVGCGVAVILWSRSEVLA